MLPYGIVKVVAGVQHHPTPSRRNGPIRMHLLVLLVVLLHIAELHIVVADLPEADLRPHDGFEFALQSRGVTLKRN